MATMRIVHDYPPLYDEINARFSIGGRSVIFAWGDIIYNPRRAMLDDGLIAHEAVHGLRQGNDIVGWWRRYIDEPEFRLAEEVPAHRAEYRTRMALMPNRHLRRGCLKSVAGKLCGPLYGGLITKEKAVRLIEEAA